MFDSAEMYGNESEVGLAILSFMTGDPYLKREEFYFTTKLASNNGYSRSLKSIEQSLKACGLGYIDLLLIHSPYGGPQARKESWEALKEAQRLGWTKSIGVSNYGVRHLKEMLDQGFKPVINQVDLHPFMTRNDIVSFCEQHDIILEVDLFRSPADIGLRTAYEGISHRSSSFTRNCQKIQQDPRTDPHSLGTPTWVCRAS